MKRFKIMLLHPADPCGNKVGGVEIFLRGFIKYAPDDFDIYFIGAETGKRSVNRSWSKRSLGPKEFSFYPAIVVPDENRKSAIPLMLRFAVALKMQRVDLRSDAVFLQRIEPAFVFRRSLKNIVLVIHNDILKQIYTTRSEVTWRFFPWLYSLVEKIAFASARKIYSVSSNSLEFYGKQYDGCASKFEFLPTWFDPDVFHPEGGGKSGALARIAEAVPAVNFKKRCLLFAGRLQEQKAPVRLVESFCEYHRWDGDSCLIVIGDGNQKALAEKRAGELGVADSVFFLGAIEQKQMAAFYRAADALLLTSNFEGMPICVLEALASGLPVVSTDVGEVRRVVKDGFSGEISCSFQPAEIARAIGRVMENSSRYSRDNCISAVKEFTPNKVLGPVYGEIRRICEGRDDSI
jgi:glycosyltransferase involved in cell wall biosynthesis